MKGRAFSQIVKGYTAEAVIPPLVGSVDNLRIGAAIVRQADYDFGVVLIGSTSDPALHSSQRVDGMCLRCLGGFTLGEYSSEGGLTWGVRAEVEVAKFNGLVGGVTAGRLIEGSDPPTASRGDGIFTVTVCDHGLLADPTINGVTIERYRDGIAIGEGGVYVPAD